MSETIRVVQITDCHLPADTDPTSLTTDKFYQAVAMIKADETRRFYGEFVIPPQIFASWTERV